MDSFSLNGKVLERRDCVIKFMRGLEKKPTHCCLFCFLQEQDDNENEGQKHLESIKQIAPCSGQLDCGIRCY